MTKKDLDEIIWIAFKKGWYYERESVTEIQWERFRKEIYKKAKIDHKDIKMNETTKEL